MKWLLCGRLKRRGRDPRRGREPSKAREPRGRLHRWKRSGRRKKGRWMMRISLIQVGSKDYIKYVHTIDC